MATTIEWWTSPQLAAARLDRVTAQWTSLEQVAVGRGLTGGVLYKQNPDWNDDLASHTGRAVADFREWRASVGGYEVITQWREQLEVWTHLANVLRSQLQRLGHVPAASLPAPLEETETVFEALGSVLNDSSATDLAAMAFGFAVLVFLFPDRR